MDIQTKTLDEAHNLVGVVLKGRLDMQSNEAVKARLREVINSTSGTILVNLEEVYFIDSAGLSALVSGLRAAREKNKDLILIGLSTQAKMVFELTMLDRIFTIFSSVENALKDLSKQNQE